MKSLLILLFTLMSSIAFAAEKAEPAIDVLGTAEMRVAPNQFVLHGTVLSFEKDVQKATKSNDEIVRKMFQKVKNLGVERKYIVTSDFRVNVVAHGSLSRGNYQKLGYEITRNIKIVLHDSTKIRKTMQVLFSNGIDRLNMTTHHTAIESLQQKVDIKAANQAKKKAEMLSSALGRRLGGAIQIQDQPGANSGQREFTYTSNTPNLGDDLSLGKIRVQSAVKVKFALK